MFYLGFFLSMAILAFAIFFSGLGFKAAFDPVSIGLTFLPGILFAATMHSPATSKKIFGYLVSSSIDSEEDRRVAISYFQFLGNITVGSGIIMFMIGAFAMLLNLGAAALEALGIGIAS